MPTSHGYWLNIDLPTKTGMLHAAGCPYETKKHETRYKGIERLKRDGGWNQFATREAAVAYLKSNHQNCVLQECSRCL